MFYLKHKGWEIFLKIKNYSQHTIDNYERDINEFFLFAEENKIHIEERIVEKINILSQNKNLLILTDVYGCTHSNIILSQKKNNFFSCVFGFNLPILLKIITLICEREWKSGKRSGRHGTTIFSHFFPSFEFLPQNYTKTIRQ